MIRKINSILAKPFLPIFATILLTVLCFMPSENLPSANDKTAHFISFMGLSFLWLNFSKKEIIVLLLCTLYGVFIEIGQFLLPESFHRSFEVLDMVADGIGVIIGYVFYKLFNYFLQKK